MDTKTSKTREEQKQTESEKVELARKKVLGISIIFHLLLAGIALSIYSFVIKPVILKGCNGQPSYELCGATDHFGSVIGLLFVANVLASIIATILFWPRKMVDGLKDKAAKKRCSIVSIVAETVLINCLIGVVIFVAFLII